MARSRRQRDRSVEQAHRLAANQLLSPKPPEESRVLEVRKAAAGGFLLAVPTRSLGEVTIDALDTLEAILGRLSADTRSQIDIDPASDTISLFALRRDPLEALKDVLDS